MILVSILLCHAWCAFFSRLFFFQLFSLCDNLVTLARCCCFRSFFVCCTLSPENFKYIKEAEFPKPSSAFFSSLRFSVHFLSLDFFFFFVLAALVPLVMITMMCSFCVLGLFSFSVFLSHTHSTHRHILRIRMYFVGLMFLLNKKKNELRRKNIKCVLCVLCTIFLGTSTVLATHKRNILDAMMFF